ncbi:MAG: hypothetical protein M1834_002562 [Cirrosporium novae-zelandiae]|nr:MAG: hypothetical protein M1834_002562 [Cirrosporium novae-zelandiae]
MNLLLIFAFCFCSINALNLFHRDARTAEALVDHVGDLDLLVNSVVKYHKNQDLSPDLLRLFDSLRTSPPCNQQAAKALLKSCSAIDGTTKAKSRELEPQLERTKSIYAARLAICEISGAGADVPPQCVPMMSNAGGYNHDSQLSSCLQELQSTPQWWTSYSNSRQNAVVMCHAARIGIEKDSLIEHYRSLTEVSSALATSLQKNHDEENANQAKRKKFMEMISIRQSYFIKSFDEFTSKTQSWFDKLFENMDSGMGTLFEKLLIKTQVANDDIDYLNKNIKTANDESIKLQENINQASVKFGGISNEIGTQEVGLQRNHEIVEQTRAGLRLLADEDISILLREISRVRDEAQLSNEVIGALLVNQNALGQVLETVERRLQQTSDLALSLTLVQQQYAQSQQRLQESVHAEIESAITRLTEVSSAAINLQTLVENTSAKVEDMQFTSGSISPLLRYGIAIWATILITGGNWPAATGLLMAVVIYPWNTGVYFGIFDMTILPWHPHALAFWFFPAATFVTAMLTIALLTLRWNKREPTKDPEK